jgi:SAM-dependent methyltransferase
VPVHVVPPRAAVLMRRATARLVNRALSAGERAVPFLRRRRCTCCGWTGLRFRTIAFVEYMRADAWCPSCGSLERHRALSSFYPTFLESLPRPPGRAIHFAPEKALVSSIKPFCRTYQTSSYPTQGAADFNFDLTEVDLPDESCDLLIMNHVLNCIPDDKPVIREMARVLTPGGIVLATMGLREGRTFEHPRASNQTYRDYGTDDLASTFSPFAVRRVYAAESLDPRARRLQGIPEPVPVLILTKN